MRHKGFTLVEVLVVIAVIAVLLSIAAPALRKGKDKSRQIVCSSNLRQLGYAASIHANDYEYYPFGFNGLLLTKPPGDYLRYASNDQQGWWWFHYFDSLGTIDTSSNGTLWCPSRSLKTGNNAVNVLCSNYGINYAFSKIATGNEPNDYEGKPLRPDIIRNPSSKLLLMDSGYALISWKALLEDTAAYPFEHPARQTSFYLPGFKANKNRSIASEQQTDAVDGRHAGKRVNITFADGHVDDSNAADLKIELDSTGEASNTRGWTP